jgi:hypothetical protein
MQRTTLSCSEAADTMITGSEASLRFARSVSSTSMPLMPGIIRSSSTRSKFERSTRSSASRPPEASVTLV